MDLDLRYHTKENMFRSYWVRLLERNFENDELEYELITSEDPDEVAIIYIRDFDVEIHVIVNTKNKAMKLKLHNIALENIEEKYMAEKGIDSIPTDEYPIIKETIFTVRDINKGSKFHSIIKKYLSTSFNK